MQPGYRKALARKYVGCALGCDRAASTSTLAHLGTTPPQSPYQSVEPLDDNILNKTGAARSRFALSAHQLLQAHIQGAAGERRMGWR